MAVDIQRTSLAIEQPTDLGTIHKTSCQEIKTLYLQVMPREFVKLLQRDSCCLVLLLQMDFACPVSLRIAGRLDRRVVGSGLPTHFGFRHSSFCALVRFEIL